MAEKKFVQEDDICIPSNTTLLQGDLPTIKFSVDIFGTQTGESFQEMPHGDALQVKSVVGEVACSKDENYKIQTTQSLQTVVAGFSSPASAPSTPINQYVRKRRNSATPLKQNPIKKRNSCTDKLDQKPKLKKCSPEILNDEDNTKRTPTIRVSKSNLKIRTPVVSSTRKAQTKRTYIRKSCSKLVADSLKNIQSEVATKSFKRALKFDMENRAGDGCNRFENKDNQAATVDLIQEVDKQCFFPVHHKTSQSLINSRDSVPKFLKKRKKRRIKRLVHIFESSCRNVKTAEVGERSDKGILLIKKLGESDNGENLNTKLYCTTEESQTALEILDMYSAVKMKRRRLAGSIQRPLTNVTSVPKEALLQLHKSEGAFTTNHDAEVGKRVGLAAKEKNNERRWRKLQLFDEYIGQVGLREQNVGRSVELNKKHKFHAKVDLNEESERVYNLLMSSGGILLDQEAEADSKKKEYWDRERNLTRIRVESFISTVGMIQGNRSFSPWKSSVVDSVVGAFLTQNVCDHFSSLQVFSCAIPKP
ncbi:uncharacterized protein LOC108201378 [Daucus carota subsp. sativus]|uniref:uncharacterized protein LOC108201378 n=1 Tax=Daucus carota subsp. sativus TaxID=79200 RepID=UPI0030839CB4